VTWDQYEQVSHSTPFVNMEYAIPEAKIEEAFDFINDTLKSNPKYNRNLFWLVRPVGADDRGYLSATRRDDGTPTYYVDVGYQDRKSEVEKKLFQELERGLLKLGGRCSFSRLFWSVNPTILENFWDKGGKLWKSVKEELDPHHVFTNDFVRSIFSYN